MKRKYKIHPTQAAFLQSTARYRAYIGGIRSGKTYVGCYAMLTELLGNARSLGMIVAPTFPMLRDSTLRTFREIAGDIIVDFNRSEMVARLIGGSEVLFRSADDPDRLRGATLRAYWIDEASQTSHDTWLIGQGRLSVAGARAWITTTPRGKQHWTYDVFGKSQPDYALFHSKTSDNPFLPAEYVPSMASAYTGLFARQELQGEFTDAEGTLFKREWFRITDKAPDDLRWVRAWDLALTTKTSSDRTASVKAAVDGFANLYIDAGIAGRWEWPEARQEIVKVARTEKYVLLVVERTAFQLAAVQELYRIPDLIGISIVGDDPSKGARQTDKVSRARPWQARAANGQVFLVAGAWVQDYLDEVCSFTATDEHEHDDYVDATSAAVKYLGMPSLIQRLRPPPRVKPYAFLD